MTFLQKKRKRVEKQLEKSDLKICGLEALLNLTKLKIQRLEKKWLAARTKNLDIQESLNQINFRANKDTYRRQWPELYRVDRVENDTRFISCERVTDWMCIHGMDDWFTSAWESGDIVAKEFGGREKEAFVSFAELDKLFWFWGHKLDIETFRIVEKGIDS